jgi:hypothetical protein
MDSSSGLSSVKMWQLFLEIYDMDDDYLMEEILNLDYTNYPHIEAIVNSYMLNGRIKADEREKLIGYYILIWYDEEWED